MFRVAIIFYSILYTIALLLYGPARLLLAALRRQKLAVLERVTPAPKPSLTESDQPVVWIHAVSVGEVNAARGLINALAAQDLQLYLSTTTHTGQEQARSLFHKEVQEGSHRGLPLPMDPTCAPAISVSCMKENCTSPGG